MSATESFEDSGGAAVDLLAQQGWSDDLLLGYGPMDETHREFVELIMALVHCDETNAVQCLEELEAHTQAHFEQERTWMATSAFPAADCHNDEHDAVLRSVGEVLAALREGRCDAQLTRDLGEKLAQWFASHAVYLDSALATWMSKKRWGAAPVVLKPHLTARR